MKKRLIIDKTILEDDNVIGIAKSVGMIITYDVTIGKAFGYYELLDENDKSLRIKSNIEINTDGWGENDEFIIQRFAEIIGVTLI